jgi:hypothetical protein
LQPVRPVQQAGPQPQQPIQFAYTPGAYGQVGDMIDYKAPTGGKLQKSAIEKLDVKHDLDVEHLSNSIKALRLRAIANGWIETILTVPQGGVSINILDNYGVVTEASCLAKSHSHMYRNNRQSQDAHNVFGCLEACLTPKARAILYTERDKYTIR